MRGKVTIIACALALLAALCVAEQVGVFRVTHEALSGARDVMERIRAGDLDAALSGARELDAWWDGRGSLLELVVDHRSTDDVRFAFSRLVAALEAGDRGSAMIYAAELEGGLEHVRERQALLPENIL